MVRLVPCSTDAQNVLANFSDYSQPPQLSAAVMAGSSVQRSTQAVLSWLLLLRCACCLQIRRLWRHYFDHVQALIYVVDSNDRERISEAKQELHNVLNEVRLTRYLLHFGCAVITLMHAG